MRRLLFTRGALDRPAFAATPSSVEGGGGPIERVPHDGTAAIASPEWRPGGALTLCFWLLSVDAVLVTVVTHGIVWPLPALALAVWLALRGERS